MFTLRDPPHHAPGFPVRSAAARRRTDESRMHSSNNLQGETMKPVPTMSIAAALARLQRGELATGTDLRISSWASGYRRLLVGLMVAGVAMPFLGASAYAQQDPYFDPSLGVGDSIIRS